MFNELIHGLVTEQEAARITQHLRDRDAFSQEKVDRILYEIGNARFLVEMLDIWASEPSIGFDWDLEKDDLVFTGIGLKKEEGE